MAAAARYVDLRGCAAASARLAAEAQVVRWQNWHRAPGWLIQDSSFSECTGRSPHVTPWSHRFAHRTSAAGSSDRLAGGRREGQLLGFSRLRIAIQSLLFATVACRSPQEPYGAASWAADLISSHRVLLMTLVRQGSALTGTGALASLIDPGSREDLTLSGTRTADTVQITYRRPDGSTFQFAGWYIARGPEGPTIVGALDGGEFNRLAVTFRNR